MDVRQKELLDLRCFTQKVETDVTMLLQSLQWDRKRLLEGTCTATCQYDINHTMPKDNLAAHESSCVLRSLGYVENDKLLPDPPDDGAHTLVKLSNIEIEEIINEASKADPLFKKGGVSHQPLSLSRLQLVYTADERRAIRDAVVAAVPSCHDLGDLALASTTEDVKPGTTTKSRMEILAELRNMKRRRAKYRVAAKTKNYSDVLRDVIRTQMESYTEAITSTFREEDNTKNNHCNNSDYGRHKSRSNSGNNKSVNHDGVQSRDKSDNRRQNSTDKRQHDVYYEERRNRESKRESSSRYENRDRSKSKKRYESHSKKSHKDDGEGFKSTSAHSDRYEGHSSHRRHDGRDRMRSEENSQRYADDRNNKLEKDKRTTRDYNESGDRYRSKYKEDKYKVEKIKDEESRKSRTNEQYDTRVIESRSKDRHERKRKQKDDDYRRKCDDTQYKRYYDIKKELS